MSRARGHAPVSRRHPTGLLPLHGCLLSLPAAGAGHCLLLHTCCYTHTPFTTHTRTCPQRQDRERRRRPQPQLADDLKQPRHGPVAAADEHAQPRLDAAGLLVAGRLLLLEIAPQRAQHVLWVVFAQIIHLPGGTIKGQTVTCACCCRGCATACAAWAASTTCHNTQLPVPSGCVSACCCTFPPHFPSAADANLQPAE